MTDYYFIILGKAALPGGPAMRCDEPVSTAAKVWLSDQRPGFDSGAPGRPPRRPRCHSLAGQRIFPWFLLTMLREVAAGHFFSPFVAQRPAADQRDLSVTLPPSALTAETDRL